MSKFNLSAFEQKPNKEVYDTLMGKAPVQTNYKEIPLEQLDDFHDHPYKVVDNADMAELAEKIKSTGQLVPAIVREKADGRYELISGHRRKRACEIAGIKTLKAEVRAIDDDEAIIIMTDCNLQRTNISPSEKGKAYKMRLEAIKRQGNRADLTSAQVEQKLNEGKTSIEIIAESAEESRAQIQRYIRLTYLTNELINLVDTDQMGISVGVELSYLSTDEQTVVSEFIAVEQKTPTFAQAKQLREISTAEGVSVDNILPVFVKSNTSAKKEQYKIDKEKFLPYTKKTLTDKQFSEIVEKALIAYFSKDEKE